MKRLLSALFVLCFLFFGAASAETLTDEDLQLAVQQDYPDWQIWRIKKNASGRWKDETAQYCKIGVLRVADNQLELKELSTLLNPLKKGDPIPLEATDWVKVSLTEEAANRIKNISPSEVYDFDTGFVFGDPVLQGAAAFLLDQGMKWEQLTAYPDYLIGIAVDSQGLQSLRIAYWDGSAYDRITLSPAQQRRFDLDNTHSYNDSLIFTSENIELSLLCDSAGVWRLDTINNGRDVEIYSLHDHGLTDITYGGLSKNNSTRHYGKPLFPVTLAELNIAEIPDTVDEAILRLDAEGYACTKPDAGLYDAVEGNQIAACYARVVGQVKEIRGDWVCMTIGNTEYGLMAWFRLDELVFGKEIEKVVCSFPSYADIEIEYLTKVLPELKVSLHEYDNDIWIIGQAPDGRWLVEINEQQVLFAPKDTFTDIGPTEIRD
ncbi:MAG: hypothetical protein ACOX6O_03835 [Christensenellales bacterium]|jgi:hypothetical protein